MQKESTSGPRLMRTGQKVAAKRLASLPHLFGGLSGLPLKVAARQADIYFGSSSPVPQSRRKNRKKAVRPGWLCTSAEGQLKIRRSVIPEGNADAPFPSEKRKAVRPKETTEAPLRGGGSPSNSEWPYLHRPGNSGSAA